MAGDFERDLEDVLSSPQLPQAMGEYAHGLTDLYGDVPQAVSILGDLGRFGIVAAVFSLPAPVTRAAILGHMGPDLAGRARIASHLDILTDAGVLEPEPGDPSQTDGRTRPVRPTPWLEAWMGRWLAAMILPARPWWSGTDAPPEPSPALLASYLGQILAANRSGLNAFVTTPGVWRMMSLVCGHLFLLELVQLSDGARRIEEPLAFSRRAFAARYSVSRPHAVDLTAEAEQLGWLVRSEDGVRLTPAFAAEARRWSAIHFLLCDATLCGRLLEVMAAASLVGRPAPA